MFPSLFARGKRCKQSRRKMTQTPRSPRPLLAGRPSQRNRNRKFRTAIDPTRTALPRLHLVTRRSRRGSSSGIGNSSWQSLPRRRTSQPWGRGWPPGLANLRPNPLPPHRGNLAPSPRLEWCHLSPRAPQRKIRLLRPHQVLCPRRRCFLMPLSRSHPHHSPKLLRSPHHSRKLLRSPHHSRKWLRGPHHRQRPHPPVEPPHTKQPLLPFTGKLRKIPPRRPPCPREIRQFCTQQ